MTSINGANHMASLALRGLDKSSGVMLEAMERLSSGKRINRSADDASGMAISLVHKAQTMGLRGAVKHASDAIGVVNSIDGSLSSANDLLLRMRELAVQASSEINTKEARSKSVTKHFFPKSTKPFALGSASVSMKASSQAPFSS